MNRLTCVMLVVLRLAIGWHFFFEGWHKIHTHAVGETTTNKPWTSEGFFREAYGPAAPYFRNVLGDPDDILLAKLRGDGAALPKALDDEWQAYFDRWADHYGLTAEQRTEAAGKLAIRRSKTAEWLKTGVKEVKKTYPSGVAEVKQTTPQRIDDYVAKLKESKAALDVKLPTFGRDVEKANLRTLKADAAKLRRDLQEDLDAEFAAMQKDIDMVLTPEQKAKPPMAAEPVNVKLKWLDTITMWFLCVVGSCLLLGIFTRTACVGLAGFLLMVTLSAPPLPYAPTPPGAVGYYLYVNLYVIELIALLMLATTRSGRWLGLDGLIHGIFGRRKPVVVQTVKAKPARVATR